MLCARNSDALELPIGHPQPSQISPPVQLCTGAPSAPASDAAFILGKGGKTKEKIGRVSGAMVELPPRSLTLEISGTPAHSVAESGCLWVRVGFW